MNCPTQDPALVRRVRHTVCLLVMLMMVTAMTGCAPTYKDLIPQQSVHPPLSNPKFSGTAIVKSKMIAKFFDAGPTLTGSRMTGLLERVISDDMLEKALAESVANSALFTRVEQKNADYVLDVWVDGLKNHVPTMGMGAFKADYSSIWRLTRVSDGKVLVCDFVDGHGVIDKLGSGPMGKSLVAGIKDMIKNGLGVLSDTSMQHVAARSVAGLRPSMGPAVPEGLTPWVDNVKNNWSRLRMGLTLEEVESFIGPVKTSGALVSSYQQGYTQEYDTGLYTIVFLNGKLSRWELR